MVSLYLYDLSGGGENAIPPLYPIHLIVKVNNRNSPKVSFVSQDKKRGTAMLNFFEQLFKIRLLIRQLCSKLKLQNEALQLNCK